MSNNTDESNQKMVEAAARAIFDRHYYPAAIRYDTQPEPTKAMWRHKAQAALDAIGETHVVVPREPTEAMIDAWCSLALNRIKRRLKDDNDCPGMREGARQSYKAMLSAAQENGDG